MKHTINIIGQWFLGIAGILFFLLLLPIGGPIYVGKIVNRELRDAGIIK